MAKIRRSEEIYGSFYIVANGYSDNILVKLFISEIVHTEDSFLLKLYYKFNFATEPNKVYNFAVSLLLLGFYKNKMNLTSSILLIVENYNGGQFNLWMILPL